MQTFFANCYGVHLQLQVDEWSIRNCCNEYITGVQLSDMSKGYVLL